MFHKPALLVCATALSVLVTPGCIRPGERQVRRGDEIVAAGQFFHTGTPVVLWLDPDGYNAYSCHRHFEPDQIMPSQPADPDDPQRYNTRGNLSAGLAARVAQQGWTLSNLQEQVTQFVIHYDCCGTARECFRVLQDVRGLSVPFMLDIDGTIYQTLDLKERAWHAGKANDRCIGIEIANIGAYPDMNTLNQWYKLDEHGWPYISPPETMTETGVRTPGFVGRPARKEVITGTINGVQLMQYDFTNEQYAALIKLTAALARIFPKLCLDVPRCADGRINPNVLTPDELANYCGLLGHWHITQPKVDPGPAFDWDRLLRGAQRQLRGF